MPEHPEKQAIRDIADKIDEFGGLATTLRKIAARLPDEPEPPAPQGPESIPGHLWRVGPLDPSDAPVHREPSPTLRTLVAVVRWTPALGEYEKLAGARSDRPDGAAWALGVHKSGHLELWAGPAGPQEGTARVRLPKDRLVLIIAEFNDARRDVDLWCAGDADTLRYSAPLLPRSGPLVLLAGYWGGQVVDPATVYVHEMHAYDRLLTGDERVSIIDEYKSITGPNGGEPDEEEEPPEEPSPPTIPPTPKQPPGEPPATEGEVRVDASMGMSAVEKAINDAPPGYRVVFSPEMFTGLQLWPKSGQVIVSEGGRALLDGDKQHKKAFRGGATDVWLQDFMVRNYAPSGLTGAPGNKRDARAQIAAIEPDGGDGKGPAARWTLVMVDVTGNHGRGVSWCNGMRLLGCYLARNGHCGAAGRAADVLVDGCIVENNNLWGMIRSWEAYLKFAGGSGGGTRPPAQNIKVLRTIIRDDDGGPWFDWNPRRIEVAYCSIYGNRGAGVIIEASAEAHIHHNQIGDNLRARPHGIFDHEIMLQNSKKCTVERNLIVVRRGNLLLLGQQNRDDGKPQGDVDVGHFTGTQNIVRRNTFALVHPGGITQLHDRHDRAQNDPEQTGVFWPENFWNMTPARDPSTTNDYAFLPQQGTDRLNVVDGNRDVRGDAALALVPDWTKLPAWDVPPGLEG